MLPEIWWAAWPPPRRERHFRATAAAVFTCTARQRPGNLVQGNYIGTDTNGSLAIPNAGDGVTVSGAGGNTIGGTDAGAGNLLSGNSQGGVGLNGAGADSNLVQGNFIGTDASGQVALGNTLSGVTILGGNSNLVGGTTTAARNIISANKLAGVYITTNSVGNLVQGNFIGVDATGANALGNATNGISIDSASLNTVGGTTAGARNIISGNTNYGIEVFNAGGHRPTDPRQLHRSGRHGAVRFRQQALRGPHPVRREHHRRQCRAALAT